MPDFDRWPELLREVAEGVSPSAALRLAGRYGGQRIKMPVKAAGSTLAEELGEDVAAVLVERHASLTITIPNFAARIAEERRRFILTHPNVSANDCARELGITARRVEQIRQEARSDPRQLALL